MIEDSIKDLKSAIEENTAVLRQILAASGGPAPAAAETPAPAKTEKVKKEKPKAEPTPAPEEKDPDLDGPDDKELTHEVLVAMVQERLASAGDKLASVKENFKALREKFEVKTIKDLTEDQFNDFAEGIAAL